MPYKPSRRSCRGWDLRGRVGMRGSYRKKFGQLHCHKFPQNTVREHARGRRWKTMLTSGAQGCVNAPARMSCSRSRRLRLRRIRQRDTRGNQLRPIPRCTFRWGRGCKTCCRCHGALRKSQESKGCNFDSGRRPPSACMCLEGILAARLSPVGSNAP